MVGLRRDEGRAMSVDGRITDKGANGRCDTRCIRGLQSVPEAWVNCQGPSGPRQGAGEVCQDNGCQQHGVVLLASVEIAADIGGLENGI